MQPIGVNGWNELDLSAEGLNPISNNFWIGIKEFGTTQPFGLDIHSNSENSYQKIDDSEWTEISGNLAYHIFLDCINDEFDECDVCGGDNSTCTDNCGVINGTNLPNTGICDCSGVPNGDNNPVFECCNSSQYIKALTGKNLSSIPNPMARLSSGVKVNLDTIITPPMISVIILKLCVIYLLFIKKGGMRPILRKNEH